MTISCPTDETLKEYATGACSDESLDAVTSHLVDCAPCQDRLLGLDVLFNGLLDRLKYHTLVGGSPQLSDFDELVLKIEQHLSQRTVIRTPVSNLSAPSTAEFEASDTDGDALQAKSRTKALNLPSIDNYEILDVLGRGGMGVVVKARQLNLNRDVAIKFPLHLTNDEARERFLREAQAAGRFRHPHICPVYEVGECEGRPYMVMAFIEGTTLRAWARDSEHSLRDSAEMLASVARGVAFAHDQDIIHRDLKPDNVLVDSVSGFPVLTDFGLAKDLGNQGDQMTYSGQVMGTAAYMSPEQAAGQTEQIGPLSDVYSLGAILYELLCKTPPFRGTVGEVLRKVQTEEPDSPRKLVPSVHRDMETICLKALNKNPAHRYASAAEFADDLERFSRGEAIFARRESLPQKVDRHVRRYKKQYGIGLALLLVVAATVTFLVFESAASQRQAHLAQREQEWTEALSQTPKTWQASHLEHLATLSREMNLLDPQGHEGRQQEFGDTLFQVIHSSIHEPARIDAEEETRIRELIGHLQESQTQQAGEVLAGLEERLVRPELAYELQKPILPGDPAYELSQVACKGNVELTAQFSPTWETASRIGVVLNETGHQQYEFVLESKPVFGEKTVRSFRVLINQGVKANLLIQRREGRNAIVLRDQEISLDALRDKPLRMKAKRTGQRLSLWIGDQKPLEFEDMFPAQPQDQGVFSLIWPQGVELTSVRAYRQSLASAASPLFVGDTAFAASDFDTALAEYRRQQNTTDSQVRREVVFKQGLCCLHLQDAPSARKAFESLIAQREIEEDPWSIRAICQLWLWELKQGNYQVANARFQQLKAMQGGVSFGKLALLIPVTDRQEILRRYGKAEDWIFFSSQNVENLEHVVEVSRLLNATPANQLTSAVQLIKAYHFDGRLTDAQRLCEEVFDEFPEFIHEHYGFTIMVFEQYSWLLRRQGANGCRQALEKLDELVFDSSRQVRDAGWHWFLVERARLNRALGNLEQAEQDLKKFYALRDFGFTEYPLFLNATLLEGFLLLDQGKPDEAQTVWKSAIQSREYSSMTVTSGFSPLVSRIIMASLSNQFTDEEIDLVIGWLQGAVPKTSKLYLGLVVARLPRSPIKSKLRSMGTGMWQSTESRELARQIAYRSLPYRDYLYEPLYAAALQLLGERVFARPITGEERDVWLGFFRDSHRVVADNKPLQSRIATLGELVIATPSLTTWEAVRPELNEHKQLQAGIAYLCGKRCQLLARAADAKVFFETARNAAPPESPIKKLAQQELGE